MTVLLITSANIAVQDFDGGEMGSTVAQYFAAIQGREKMSWHVQPAGLFPNGPSDLAHAVVEEHCWVAISSCVDFSTITCPM